MEFNYESRLLSSSYVFYDRLKDGNNYRRNLYETAIKKFNNGLEELQLQTTKEKLTKYAETLEKMAKREESKELRLLKEVFGVNISKNTKNSLESGKKIIDAYNTLLGLKKLYERNKLLFDTNGLTPTSGWAGSYIKKAVYEGGATLDIKNKTEEVCKQVTNGELDEGAGAEILVNYLETRLMEAYNTALVNMCNAQVELKNSPEMQKYQDAYKEILSYLNEANNKKAQNEYIRSLMETFQTDKVIKSIRKELDQSKKITPSQISNLVLQNLKSNFKQINSKGKEQIKGFLQSKGNVYEAMRALEVQVATDGKLKNGYKMTVKQTGKTNIKPDNTFIFSQDSPDITEKIFEEKYFKSRKISREENIKEANKLAEKLSKINKNFIVYTNAKLYTLNENFKGYKSESVNFDSFKSYMKNTGTSNDLDTFLGVITQLGIGSIGEKKRSSVSSLISRMLSEEIAKFLFDDYEKIGKQTRGSSTAIHLMDLNGTYVPISFIFRVLSKAVADTKKNFSRNFQVNFSVPKIIYPDDSYMDREDLTKQEAWDIQRDHTQEKITINIRILKNFKEIINTAIREIK